MFNVSSKLAFVVCLVASAQLGCEGADVYSPNPESTLANELRSQPSYEIGTSTNRVTAEAAALRADREARIDFAVLSGDAVVALDDSGRLALVDLAISLDDVTVPSDILPPSGLELTNIQIELAGVVSSEASWNETGDRVEATLAADLVLHWSTRRDGRDIPLADIRVDSVPVVITAERRDGRTALTIRAVNEGAFWTWARTFELRDLDLDIDAS